MAKRSRGVVSLDERARISLGRYADHDTYRVTVKPNGVIELVPVALVLAPQYASEHDTRGPLDSKYE